MASTVASGTSAHKPIPDLAERIKFPTELPQFDHSHGQRQISAAERAFQAGSSLLSGTMAISASQFMGAPLKLISEEYYNTYMALTKQAFAVLVTTITQWWSPTIVRVSGDASMKGQLLQLEDGTLKTNFPKRLVLMANHQLYTDWLYLWWIAYCNGMHGHVYIILKESLKNLPIIGWSAQFYNFIFLARDWKKDKSRFEATMRKMNKSQDPMWLLIFPEGTNLAKGTREASKRWADKNGIQDMKHQLLPRSTGIQCSLKELRKSTAWLYDCTIAYEGVPEGQFGQDIFTLRSSFLEGKPPESVNMHWRRFRIADIPLDNDKQFEVWLRNRWREKDYLLEHFERTKRFPADENWMINSLNKGTKPRQAPFIETEVKSGSWEEFLSLFTPITGLMSALFLFYSDPQALLNPQAAAAALQNQNGLVKDITQDESQQLPDPKRLGALSSASGGPRLATSRSVKSVPNRRAPSEASSTSSAPKRTGINNTRAASVQGSAAQKRLSAAGQTFGHGPRAQTIASAPMQAKPGTSGPVKLANCKVVANAPSSTPASAAKSGPLKLADGRVLGPTPKPAAQGVKNSTGGLRLPDGRVVLNVEHSSKPKSGSVSQPSSQGGPIKLADGRIVGNAPAKQTSKPAPVRLADGRTLSTQAAKPAVPKPTQQKQSTPKPAAAAAKKPPKLGPSSTSTVMTAPGPPGSTQRRIANAPKLRVPMDKDMQSRLQAANKLKR